MKYEEIAVGTKETLSHLVTQDDIEKFVDLTGDDNKLHVDKEFASRTSFKKPVVHGMIGASFISTMIGTKLPGDGALWFSQTLEFLLPVRIGDEITVVAEVIRKYDRERIIELNIEILNQNRQVVTRGISKVKVIEEETAPVPETLRTQAKTALVIGATGGIGHATCLELAKDGFDLMIHFHKNKSKAQSLQRQIQAMGRQAFVFQADVTKEEEFLHLVRAAERKLGMLSFAVNCAASAIPPIKITDLVWEDFLHQLEVNIRVNLLLVKELVPAMTQNKSGKIVLIGTVYTDKPNPNLVHYTTAKAALEGFTKSMAFELAPKGICVNMVAPSVISTELTADIPEKVKLMTAAQTPLRRLATPEDVAGAVAFLAGDRSNFLSGEIIRLNGGQVMI